MVEANTCKTKICQLYAHSHRYICMSLPLSYCCWYSIISLSSPPTNHPASLFTAANECICVCILQQLFFPHEVYDYQSSAYWVYFPSLLSLKELQGRCSTSLVCDTYQANPSVEHYWTWWSHMGLFIKSWVWVEGNEPVLFTQGRCRGLDCLAYLCVLLSTCVGSQMYYFHLLVGCYWTCLILHHLTDTI